MNLQVRYCKFHEIKDSYIGAMDEMKLLQKCVTTFTGSHKIIRGYRNKALARNKLLYLCVYMQQCVIRGYFRKDITYEILEFMVNDYSNTFYIPILN